MKVKKELLKLYVEYVKNHRSLAPDTFIGMSAKDMKHYLEEMLDSYELETYYDGKELIGFCTYYIAKVPYSKITNMYIGDLGINPKFHSRGHGKELMAKMIKIAKLKKCKNISLTVHSNNTKAMRFYSNHDFYTTQHTFVKEL